MRNPVSVNPLLVKPLPAMDRLRLESPSEPENLMGSDKAMLRGLARLVDGLRCFADELGLAPHRVVEVWEEFQGKNSEEVLNEWLDRGEEGCRLIERLFEDLIGHQMALLKGMEEVVRVAVDRLSPQIIAQDAPQFMGLRPAVWSHYCRTYQNLLGNEEALYRESVMPGFIAGYIRFREERGGFAERIVDLREPPRKRGDRS